jgi:excisionase family DNA binding protein
MSAAQLLTPAQVAERLAIHPETAALWMRTGHLPARNLSAGKRRACWRISEKDLETWVAKRPAA